MAGSEASAQFMGRQEYDPLVARTEANFSFVDEVDGLFSDTNAPLGEVRFKASSRGLEGHIEIKLDEYSPDAITSDETLVKVSYVTANKQPADDNYRIRVETLPQKRPNDAIVTDYTVRRDGGRQYVGHVYESLPIHKPEVREMTCYDYEELRRILALARTVQLAEQRERAMIKE